jgi:multidrug efflux system membrane fusion protein
MDDRTATSYAKPGEKPGEKPAEKPDQKTRPAPPKRRRGLWLLLLLIVAGGLGYWIYDQRSAPVERTSRRDLANAPVPVEVMAAAKGDIDITLNALGTVTSLATVTVASQISGYLVRVDYTEGQTVKKGDLLAEIDSRPYELALAQAQGTLQRDQALLQTAELDLKRYQDLAKTNAIPRQQLDTQVSLVAQYQGNVLSDQAQIDTQRLNVEYCRIKSPVNGIVGLRLVDPGNYVTPQMTPGLVVITQVEPISVIFPVAEDNLPQIRKRMREVGTLPVTAYDRGVTMQLSSGELRATDSQINTTTGTLNMRAQFSNTDRNLFPNQFVNIRLLIDTLHDATVVSTSAIQRGAPGTFVYLLRPDGTVEVRPIVLGPTSADRVAITNGISPGDRVVIDGADKLRNGAKITLRGALAGSPAAGAPAGASENPPGRGDGGSRRGGNPANPVGTPVPQTGPGGPPAAPNP